MGSRALITRVRGGRTDEVLNAYAKKGKKIKLAMNKTNVRYSVTKGEQFCFNHVSITRQTKVYVCTTRNVFEDGYKTYYYNFKHQ